MLEKIRLYWGEAVWFLLIFSLPFTSLPLVSKLMGGTMVSPPAILILILLILAWLVPWVLRGHQFPAQVVPLLVFVIAVLIATSASAFLPIPSFRGHPSFHKQSWGNHYVIHRRPVFPGCCRILHWSNRNWIAVYGGSTEAGSSSWHGLPSRWCIGPSMGLTPPGCIKFR